MIEPDGPEMTIWCMRIACWIPKATNAHSEYVMLIAFHYNNGCMNAPQWYVICTLPTLFTTFFVPFTSVTGQINRRWTVFQLDMSWPQFDCTHW